jgi:hypothetical protein
VLAKLIWPISIPYYIVKNIIQLAVDDIDAVKFVCAFIGTVFVGVGAIASLVALTVEGIWWCWITFWLCVFLTWLLGEYVVENE